MQKLINKVMAFLHNKMQIYISDKYFHFNVIKAKKIRIATGKGLDSYDLDEKLNELQLKIIRLEKEVTKLKNMEKEF